MANDAANRADPENMFKNLGTAKFSGFSSMCATFVM